MQSQIEQVRIELARRELAKRSPALFYEHLHWGVCEPGKKFVRGWFHEYLDDILLACYKRQLKRVVINIQPRVGKSGLFSVSFPCWMWLNDPHLRYIHLSHSYPLSMKLAEERLTVMQSEAYQSIAYDRFALLTNRKKEILNNYRGYSYVMNPDNVTGVGADFILMDDYQSAGDCMSNTIREGSNLTFENAIMSRLDDKENGVIIVIMQRLHAHDICGYLSDAESNFGFETFKIKTQETCDQQYFFPYSGKVLQRYEGDLLQPKREGREYINNLKSIKRLWNIQHQQDTDSEDGDIFNDYNFAHHAIVPQIEYRVLSIDTATTDNVGTSSRWCFSLFGSEHKSLYKARNSEWALMDCYAKEFVYTTGRSALIQYIKDNKINLVLIERKSSGQDLEHDLPEKLKEEGIKGVKIEMITPIRDKLTRAYLAVPYCDLVSIPSDCDHPWFAEWKKEVFPFPAQYDDRVDTLTQFIRWLKFTGDEQLSTHKTEIAQS
jgi:predicted phage terminase large subunit-like protein